MTPLDPLQFFKYLSEDTRLTIILLLRSSGELCVCELVAALNETQPKISRHLAMLREGGVLADRRQGKWIHYRLSPHLPMWAANIIEQAWQCQMAEITAITKQLAQTSLTSDGKFRC
ncbi:MAG: metalloregulator ArsR/SmtB family transcription factor [Rouxiella aceris]|uniref:metalloregulator ArsR/SmtB family transcription factor n=1 Tax=Rouxiella aceris TaxID=2703884 RepID=UPI00283D4158|nr:metalloregulator ArsR/SmtB family transcription factor [Rouxiella aceris]MDR3433086.1 metalloregulator ArsR/SmtB family transcription factor [Rouxiella aceris]